MDHYFNKECRILLAIGAVAGVAITKILGTKKARDITVNSLAKGFILKDTIMEEVENIREEAMDICANAKVIAKGECED